MRKIVFILMFVAVFGMLISSVSGALDMHSMDFDNGFTIDAPDKHWIGDQVPFGKGYFGEGVKIHYFTDDDLQGTSLDEYIELQQYDEVGNDGNLTIYKSGNKYVVLTQSENEYCLITDSDLDEAKEIAKTAVFASSSSDEKTAEQSTPAKSTVDLKSEDFEDFKMDVPKDSKFKETNELDDLYNNGKIYSDSVNDLNITYADDSQIDDKYIEDLLEGIEEDGAKLSTNGNFYLIEAGPYNELLFNNGTQLILIVSSDLDVDTITAMAQSVKFD